MLAAFPSWLPLPSQPQNKSQAQCQYLMLWARKLGWAAAIGVHSGDQPMRPMPRRKATPTLSRPPRPTFLLQRGRRPSSPLDAEASLTSPVTPHVSNHGCRLFCFLSVWGRGCSPAPRADTCAIELSPGRVQMKLSLHPSAAMVTPLSPCKRCH